MNDSSTPMAGDRLAELEPEALSEVLLKRIHRGAEDYAVHKLGAYSEQLAARTE